MFLTLLCSGGGQPLPPFPGINPKVSCNENFKGKIYDENTMKINNWPEVQSCFLNISARKYPSKVCVMGGGGGGWWWVVVVCKVILVFCFCQELGLKWKTWAMLNKNFNC